MSDFDDVSLELIRRLSKYDHPIPWEVLRQNLLVIRCCVGEHGQMEFSNAIADLWAKGVVTGQWVSGGLEYQLTPLYGLAAI